MAVKSLGKQNPEELPSAPAAALYLHVPFCRAKCSYCDFYSHPARPGESERFLAAIGAELDRHGSDLHRPLASVFVGGGTPTALRGDLLDGLLGLVGPLRDGRTEFSVEANPATVGPAEARLLADAGVTRVNLGAQSFYPGELRTLGRIHSPEQIPRACQALRAAGIENLGVDLIYAVPGQTLKTWRDSLSKALALAPSHLSCYALSYEPGTPLERARRAREVRAMPDEQQEACYRAAIDAAAGAGLEHYETSNFARPGRQCRHNLVYWHNEPYLGLGPSAASYLGGVRRTNQADLDAYIGALQAGERAPCTEERLLPRPAMAETLMLGLRLIAGVDRAGFERRFGQDPVEAFPRTFERYAVQGAVVVTPSHLRLAPEALFVADTVLADLLAEA